MPSPRRRRQKKVLLREQQREEVLEVLPVEVEAPAPEPIAKNPMKTVKEVFSSILDDDEEEE